MKEDNTKYFTLYELNSMVAGVISRTFDGEYWVEAELSELRVVRGNCYMEMVQKDADGNIPVARASAKCWRNAWMLIEPYFERVTGQRLNAGMKVLMKVYPQFHENYGFSWIVTDVDPVFTLGDMARRRREIIKQLKEQGILELNKELPMPMFAQSIAVISAANAAGYGDFCKQINDNAFGFKFKITLFEAVMQGEATEASIIKALDAINDRLDNFDCVVIIRGGGAVSDLSAFDSAALAENVANFPLPVITGIGHERDDTILDIVAHTRMKTPTAVAAFLIDNLKTVADRIDALRDDMTARVRLRLEREQRRMDMLSVSIRPMAERRLMTEDLRIERLAAALRPKAEQRLTAERVKLDRLTVRMRPAFEHRMMAERHRLELMAERVAGSDPSLLLKRGYSITLREGRVVHDAESLKEGDVIETRLHHGSLTSTVICGGSKNKTTEKAKQQKETK